MRAARFHEYGGIDKIVVDEVPDPEPQAHEVKIKVGACALNHLDVDFREGISRFPAEPPVIFGLELAGEIVETGSELLHLLAQYYISILHDGMEYPHE